MIEKQTGYPRPVGVTIIAFGVLSIAVTNLIRMVLSIYQWEFHVEILPFSPIYLVLTGLVWGIGGCVLAFGLLTGRIWAPRLARWGSLIYLIYVWIDRLFLRSTEGRGTNTWFILGLGVLFVLIVFFVLNQKKSIRYFGAANGY